MSLKKVILKIHLWLGLASGLVVFVLGITGCIYAFEKEIKGLVYTGKLVVDTTENKNPKPFSESFESAEKALGPEQPITFIQIPNNKSNSFLFRSRGKLRNPTDVWSYRGNEFDYMAYVDPYSANTIKVEDYSLEFFELNRKLHTTLLLRSDIGHKIVGTATLIFIIILITGLILWWPNNKKVLRIRTWFRWKSTTRWKRKNYDLHNILGFYSMFFALVIAITGLVWSFDWWQAGIRWLANGGQTIKRERIEIVSNPQAVASVNPLDVIYGNITTNYPEAEKYFIIPPKDSLAPIITSIIFKNRTKSISVLFDQYNGKQLSTYRWNNTNGDKVRSLNYDIHVGAIGGIVGKTLAFFTSLFSASLPVTGFLIWYGRTFKKRKRKLFRRKKPVTLKPSETS